jgi:hypothetical protein
VEGGSSDDSLSADSEEGDPSTMAAAPAIMSSITGISGLSDLLLQLPSDILQLVPKPKSAAEESWFLLHKAEVARAKIDIFQSLNILRVFRRAQCTVLDSADWKTIVLGRYFPRKNVQHPKSLQHFPVAAYDQKWENMMKEAADENSASAIRETVGIWFGKLLWLPFPESDRMWSTKKASGIQWQMVPQGAAEGLCPRVAINVDLCDKTTLAGLWNK